jgi:hypothetical protein
MICGDAACGLASWHARGFRFARLSSLGARRQHACQEEQEIDLLADDSAALSPEERRKKMSEIESSLLELERAEESVVLAEGCPRRPDADPRAILGLSDSAPAPRRDF